MTRRLTTLAAALLALLALAPAAQADRADTLLIEACRTGAVTGRYSQSDFRKAITRIPADSDQYTDCRDVLRRAQLEAASGGDKPGAGGPSTGAGAPGPPPAGALPKIGGIDPATGKRADPLATATPAERKDVEKAARTGGSPFVLAGETVTPGSPGALAGSTLPPALIVLVALLLALALGGSGWAGLHRVRARHGT